MDLLLVFVLAKVEIILKYVQSVNNFVSYG